MKCSECRYCKPKGEFFKCTNKKSKAFNDEIFDPEAANCLNGKKTWTLKNLGNDTLKNQKEE